MKRRPSRRAQNELLVNPRAARARYPHGTRARYNLGRCRCGPCKAANRKYKNARTAHKRLTWRVRHIAPTKTYIVCHVKTGKVVFSTKDRDKAFARRDKLNGPLKVSPRELISTNGITRHVAALRRQGVGLHTIANVSGVSRGVLQRILDGDIVRTRASTERRVLAVGPDTVKGGMRVRSDDMVILVERLVAAGYRRGWIALQTGRNRAALHVGKRQWIRLAKARAVYALYMRIRAHDSSLPPPPAALGEIDAIKIRKASRSEPAAVPSYPHGTRARYTVNQCRCARCAKANREFERCRSARKLCRYGIRKQQIGWAVLDFESDRVVFHSSDRESASHTRDILNSADPRTQQYAYVDVGITRAHINHLRGNGLSDADIAAAAGVKTSSVWMARQSVRKRIRQITANAILAVSPDTSGAGTVYVDAQPVHTLVDRLLAAGFDAASLEHILRFGRDALRRRLSKMRLDRARRIMVLYAALRDRVSAVRELEQRAGAAVGNLGVAV